MQADGKMDEEHTPMYKLEDWISMLILFVLVVVVCLQIASRYFFNSPLFWTEEISRNLLIVMTFIGAAIAVRNKANISLDFILGFLSETIRRPITGLALLLESSFYLLGTYLSIQMAIFSRLRFMVSVQISRGILFGLVAFGFALMAFRCLSRFFAFIRISLREGK